MAADNDFHHVSFLTPSRKRLIHSAACDVNCAMDRIDAFFSPEQIRVYIPFILGEEMGVICS